MSTRVVVTAGVGWTPVRRHLRAVRRSHSTRSVAGVASLVYQWLLYLFVAGGVVVTALRSTIASFTPPPGLGWWLAAASVPAGVAAIGSVLLALGPVVVLPAYASWLLPSPVDRRGLLGRRTAVVAVATGAVAAGAIALVASGAGTSAWLPLAACGFAAGVLLAALCALAQAGGPGAERAATLAVRAVLVVSLLGTVTAVLADRARLEVPATTDLPAAGVWPATAIVAVLAAAACAAVWRRLDRATTPSLTRGASLVAGLWAATAGLDPDMTVFVIQERRLRRRGVVRSRRHRPGRRRALLAAHRHAALRDGSAWAWTVGFLVVPYVAALLVPGRVVPVVQFACVMAVAARFAAPLRTVAGSAALRRALGGRDGELMALHCVLPFLVAAVWTLLVAPSGGSVLSLVLLPLSALAVLVRHATKPPREATVTLYETPMGISIPVEVARDLSRGSMLFVALAGVQFLTGGA